MLKPQIPTMPGVGAMTDTLDFVKNLWGSMNVPGMAMPGMSVPTLSVEDLEKKIADLKAVESWLNVNLTMLHGTIQALEVQRATISTLQSMGASLAEAMKQPGADPRSILAAAPFASALFPQAAGSAPSAAEQAGAGSAPSPTGQAAASSTPPAATPAMPNPAAWWNLLQDQFTQAVTSAMSSSAAASAGSATPAEQTGANHEQAAAKRAKRAGAENGAAKPKAGKG